jgi:hypothetical protein
MLFLHLAEGLQDKMIILTDESMHIACMKEVDGVRAPREIHFLLATIPDHLQLRLVDARAAASREVTREKIEQLPDELMLPSKHI